MNQLQPTQLEEAKRKLVEEAARAAGRGANRRFLSGNGQSNQSTLRKPKSEVIEEAFTVVVFNFCDEQFPYRTKIPGHNVTLKQFKDYLPKKGSYR